MWTSELELLHQLAHQSPDYEATMERDDIIINVAVAAGEMILIQLGLAIILGAYPCLTDRVVAFQERLEELVEAQLPEETDEDV